MSCSMAGRNIARNSFGQSVSQAKGGLFDCQSVSALSGQARELLYAIHVTELSTYFGLGMRIVLVGAQEYSNVTTRTCWADGIHHHHHHRMRRSSDVGVWGDVSRSLLGRPCRCARSALADTFSGAGSAGVDAAAERRVALLRQFWRLLYFVDN
eukprot:4132586-Pleurochrysis_carterae.AAC.2